MSLFTKLVKKSMINFLHKRKKWLIMPALSLGLLIGVNLTLNYYVDKVVGTLIKEFVHEKSNGFYYVDFKEIAYILNNGRFYMSEFKFDVHPDHRAGFDSLDHKYIFSATIPSLHIDIIDFWSIFVSRKLRVIGIDISEPFIKIINLNKDKTPKKLSFEAGNLYEILSGHLKELKVNDFRISGAEFDYETHNGPDYDNFRIKELTFEVNNFQVNEDANKRKDKIFYTDDIFLEIKDQKLLLKDSLHKVSFDKFYISTKTNEFGFKNFKLARRNDAGIKFKRHDHYEIDLPVLRLAGIDFLSAYNDNLLKIDSLNIEDPVVNIMKRTVKEHRDSSPHNILDAAMIYHDFLKIDHFNLSDAHLIVTDATKPISKQYRVNHISAHVTKVEIDAGSNSKYRYGFNFGNADLIVKDYEVKLPDSLNTVKFDEFSVSSDPFEIKLKELSIEPSRTGDSTESTSLLYASIPYLVITEFDIAQAINADTFLVDEIYIENPEVNFVQSGEQKARKTERGPGGLFGIYERIQSMSDYFRLNNLNLVNGKFVIENPSSDQELNLELNGVNVGLENLEVDRLTNIENDFYGTLGIDLSVSKSTIDMPFGTINFKYLDFESRDGKLMVDSMQIALDSSKIRQNVKVNLPELLLTGINPNEVLFKNKISLDSLKFGEVSIYADLLSELPGNENSLKNARPYTIPRIEIDHLVGLDYDIDFRKKGSRLFYADNINFNISKLIFDQTISDDLPNQFDYSEIHRMSIDNYDFYLRNQNHLLLSEKIQWNNSDSTFSMKGIRLEPIGEANNRYDIEIPGITMSGIDLKRVLKDSYYDGDDIIIKNPKINLKLAKGKRENLTSLDLGFIPVLLQNRYLGARANTFEIDRAELNFHQQIENDSLIVEIDNFNLLVDNFEVDSTTKMVPERFLFANDVHLQGDYLSCFVRGKSDFYNVNHFNISTKEKDIFLNGIYYGSNTADFSFNKAKTKLSIENLNIMDFDFFDFTQNRILEISDILIDNADLHHIPALNKANVSLNMSDSAMYRKLTGSHPAYERSGLLDKENRENAPDSILLANIKHTLSSQFHKPNMKAANNRARLNFHKEEYLFDTMLLKKIKIDRLLISDSKMTFEHSNEDKTGVVAPDLWFLAEGLKYDPVAAKDSSRIFYTDNLKATVSNFRYVLPDNLSSVRIDELTLNSKDSSVKANNFAIIPLVNRYDYGPAKGFQATWIKMENDSITLGNVDFLGILNERTFNAGNLNVHKPDISIFRDKRVPFPEWQRMPLPQASLRGLNFNFGIDTIKLHNGFISYHEHAEKAYTTGEVFFSDLDATIVNATNDSARTLTYPNTRIGATAKIFDAGAVKAEFVFDLVDLENVHSYGVDVEPFDLTEFNRILIPTASVQISSGDSKKIIMSAKANEDYSYGEMKFYYEDLKIKLLNRETETPKGIGNALGSFFANTFIIKSNNPRNLFLRKGDIFFERDKKRAIFNYWTKTFLSGVVSSIGAANNKKKIKKMQEENLKKIQDEKDKLATL